MIVARPVRLWTMLRASTNTTEASATLRQYTHSGSARRPASANGIHDGGRSLACVRRGPLPFDPPVNQSRRSTSEGNTAASTSVTIARYSPLTRVAGMPTSRPAAKHTAAVAGTAV